MQEQTRGDPRYPVRAVIARTGLTADVLRAWERRYGAVQPSRSSGGQRLYSEEDVARLALLRRATVAGHSIAEVATLPLGELELLLDRPMRAEPGPSAASIAGVVESAMGAVDRLDSSMLDAVLRRGVLVLGGVAMVDHVLARLLHRLGDRWQEGSLSPAHEHLASAVVRRVLGWIMEQYAPASNAPPLVVATPEGEWHELGAMLAAATAAGEGWRVLYFGPSLPSAHVVRAVESVGAGALALSLVQRDAPELLEEVLATARALPEGVTLFAGGAGAASQAAALDAGGVRVMQELPAFRRALRAIRTLREPVQPAIQLVGA